MSKKLYMDLTAFLGEIYGKSFLSYRISLENWLVLRQILAYTQGEKLDNEKLQKEVKEMFDRFNKELLENLERLTKELKIEAKPPQEAEEKKKEA
ncbi:hypothetical protein [Desulfurobacterium crinifex]